MGYEILQTHELYQYEKSDDLFKSYVDTFIGIKQAASALPSNMDPDEYKRQFKQHMGFECPEGEYNEGKRAVAKLCLNSLWGKFAQRKQLEKVRYVYSKEQMLGIMNDSKVEIKSVMNLTEDTSVVKIMDKTETLNNNAHNATMTIAAFTTAHARLVLYEFNQRYGRQVLYNDTDSAIITYDPTNPEHIEPPVPGNFLGEWTDELDGGYIDRFSSIGPKSYCYHVQMPDGSDYSVMKMKGVTLDYANSQELTYDSFEEMLLSCGDEQVTTTNEHYIDVAPHRRPSQPIRSVKRSKVTRLDIPSLKRRMLQDEQGIGSVPFFHIEDDHVHRIAGREIPSKEEMVEHSKAVILSHEQFSLECDPAVRDKVRALHAEIMEKFNQNQS